MVNNWLNKVPSWLFPHRCVLCNAAGQSTLDLCIHCQRDLPWLDSTCQRCGWPIEPSQNHDQCGHCLNQALPYDRAISLLEYRWPIDQMVIELKFEKKRAHARVLATLMAQLLPHHYHDQSLPQLITSVPMHPQRLRERGFNQADLIAKRIAGLLGIPYAPNLASRTRYSKPQTGLNAQQRAANIAGCFECDLPHCESIAIVDDVFTTGSTTHELSKQFQKTGVKQVHIWTLARTL